MRSLIKSNHGNIEIIMMAVTAAIVIAISLIIVYSVIGGLGTSDLDGTIAENVYGNASRTDVTPAGNASDNLLDNLETFFTISPIYIVVLAAVGIIGAIMMIMVRRK